MPFKKGNKEWNNPNSIKNRFTKNHNKNTEETKKKWKKKVVGQKRTDEQKKRISDSIKNGYENGRINPRKGVKMLEETKKKIGLGNKGNLHTAETKEKIRIKRLKQILPTKDTSIEIKIQTLLSDKGIKFEKHKSILGKYQVDIFIKPNLIIECDGDYWHNRPGVKEKDKRRDEEFNKNNYKILRLLESDIKNNLDYCWKCVKQEMISL